ncbi:hypothetical protein MATL_G00073590 [Megalops atlanticus]|uniref:Immunoglobulin domain-containing protein n=1 Tax=Megalops atlanticus TaxID=7932 RepID=A0A9D3Q7F2_MEGAT|nr:hypothetical protein MATL_G00073590 [Megalops atlanticus]
MELFLVLALLSGVQSLYIWGPGEVKGREHGTLTIECSYDAYYKEYVKYWCYGENFKTCTPLAKSNAVISSKVSLREDKRKRAFYITMNDLTVQDSGKYWCAISIFWGSDKRVAVKVSVEKVMPVVPTKPRTEAPTTTAATTVTSTPSEEPTVISTHTSEKPDHGILPTEHTDTSSGEERSPTMTRLGITAGLLLLILCLVIIIAWRRVGSKRRRQAAHVSLQSSEEATEITYTVVTARQRSQPLCDFNTYANLSFDTRTPQLYAAEGSVEYACIRY